VDRVAKMIDSPYHPYSDTRFTVNERGLDDVDEKAPKKKAAGKDEEED
jgi:DNA repair protein RadA